MASWARNVLLPGDAQKAWDQFADERRPRYHRLEGEVVAEEVVKRPPGRPRRDAPVPTITRYAIRAGCCRPPRSSGRWRRPRPVRSC